MTFAEDAVLNFMSTNSSYVSKSLQNSMPALLGKCLKDVFSLQILFCGQH